MNENDLKVVRVTNISDFDFTGELGARYCGTDFEIPAGKSLLIPFTAGDHLATHLARQILLRKAPIRDSKEVDGRGSDRPLWDDKIIADLKAKILTNVYEEERAPTLSEGAQLAAKVKELNKVVKEPEEKGGNADASTLVPVGGVDDGKVPASEGGKGEDLTYKDKAEVIAELTKRGITFNARDNKAKLEELLK